MEVIDYVKEFLKHNSIYDVVLSTECKEGSLATYNFESKVMEINQQDILNKSKQMNLSITDTVSILFSHELGHYLDPTLKSLSDKRDTVYEKIKNDVFSSSIENLIDEGVNYEMQAEKNAWTLGAKYVPARLLNDYEHQKQITLSAHEMNARSKFKWLVEITKQIETEKTKLGL